MKYMYTPESLVDLWFREDIGEGDHTTLSTIPPDSTGKAKLLVKEEGVLAGMEIAKLIFKRFDEHLVYKPVLEDGSYINNGDVAFKIEGKVQSILQSERLVLNVMQRMCGIATVTHRYVRAIEGTGAMILDTRKTTPGFRYIEKEAVRIGGGINHRIGLYDMILIKDNHIDFAGSIAKAVERATDYLQTNNLDLIIEVEVRTLDDIREVLKIGKVHRVLLDNFSVELTKEAVDLIAGRIETESSGGINMSTIRHYAVCGVDYISVGALTHQIKSLDLSLKADF